MLVDQGKITMIDFDKQNGETEIVDNEIHTNPSTRRARATYINKSRFFSEPVT